MPNELGVAASFLSQRLWSSDALVNGVQGRIYPNKVPAQAEGADYYPNVVYGFVSGIDTLGMGEVRVFVRPLYLVRVIGMGDGGDIGDLADMVDDLLHGAEETMTLRGLTFNISCCGERPFERSDFNQSEDFIERGRYYRLTIDGPL